MGLFQVEIEVFPANGGAPQIQSVLVDTGASYLALPRSLLTSLGYRAIDQRRDADNGSMLSLERPDQFLTQEGSPCAAARP